MLRLRPYRKSDLETVVSWIGDEKIFFWWNGGKLPSYPVTPEMLGAYYEADERILPVTLYDRDGLVGHLFMRFEDEKDEHMKFGFIILNPARRGMGYGKEMISLAMKYAFDILRIWDITLNVYEDNLPAIHCYENVGFEMQEEAEPQIHTFGGEKKVYRTMMADHVIESFWT